MNEDGGSDPNYRGRVRRRSFAAATSLGSAALAVLFFLEGSRGVLYDSFHYFTLSRIISTEGLWSLHSRVRTYGYPLFISLVTGFSNASPQSARVLVFAAQLSIYLAAALYASRVAERIFGSERFFYGTYLAMALDPIALIRTTEMLSDLLSAVLILLALLPPLEKGRPLRRAFVSFLCAGLSVAVRPANLAVLPALAVIWLLRARLYGERPARPLCLGGAAIALALAPQLYGNVSAYDVWTPLLPERLYREQVGWGMSILKYGTLVLPGRAPELVYENPFYPRGASSPGEFLKLRPLGYAATLGLHAFALVDQDLPFSYVNKPRLWYRWPLSLWNYAFLFFAGLSVTRALARRPSGRSAAKIYFVAAALTSTCYAAIYLPVAVESRFSTPLYLVLAPAAVAGALWLAERRPGTVLGIGIAGCAFVAICVRLSLWLAAQAPVLASLLQR